MNCQQCVDAVKQKNPPVMCSREHCMVLMPEIDQYCYQAGVPYDSPIPIVGPDGKVCWCCCGQVCGTIVLTAPGEYRHLDTLRRGDTVLTGHPGANAWIPVAVLALVVPENADGVPSSVALVVDFPDGRTHSVTLNSEMLVMLEDGRLKHAGRLDKDDVLRTAAGGKAQVRHNRATSELVAVPYLGPLDTANLLSGHLLDLNGLVCADLAVSTAVFAGSLPDGMWVPAPAPRPPLSASSAAR